MLQVRVEIVVVHVSVKIAIVLHKRVKISREYYIYVVISKILHVRVKITIVLYVRVGLVMVIEHVDLLAIHVCGGMSIELQGRVKMICVLHANVNLSTVLFNRRVDISVLLHGQVNI